MIWRIFSMHQFLILGIKITMNISQHLALFIKQNLACNTVFTLTGGGAMFLNDAFGNCKGINCIYTHHEQAAAMAALGQKKQAGVCVTATGCGATNSQDYLTHGKIANPCCSYGQVKKKQRFSQDCN